VQLEAMDTLPPWAQLVIAALVAAGFWLLPSPLQALVRRLSPPAPPPSDEEGAKRAYRAWSRAQVAPADPFPPFEDMPDRNRQIWRDVARAVVGLPMALVLVCLMACSAPQRTAKHDLAAAVNSDADAIERFGAWDREKQLKIRARCEAQHVGEVECDKRLAGYRETRDALHALLRRSIVTLDSALKMLGAEEGK
jgi:hypothetical protein